MEKANKISIEEVEHIAELARIELSEAEKKEFAGQLSDVLGYIDQLKEVNTDNVEPVSQVTGLVNVTREDIVKDSDEKMRQGIVNNFPDREGEYVKVKQVL
ncbi:MAG: Asp-tRNA(Asn)/Glu-tRNA(Gln) amidotransferase subunit GatC [Candidatus Paceibacterota bacterium]|jgi:aspartyl-tRNA(Asn)/glutamyl-tRNA(Gln) amidotransferase subunit C